MKQNNTFEIDPVLTLPEQIFQKIVSEIKTGKLLPGQKLPSDRALAKQYGIGRGSVIGALKRLEEESYIERIPVRGSFVRNDAAITSSEITIAFISPELSISIDTMGPENWGINFEIFRGVNHAASKLDNVNIVFRYMVDSDDDIILRRQKELLKSFDGVIFLGHDFATLKNIVLRENIPAVVIAPDRTFETPVCLPVVEYDREHAFELFYDFLKTKNADSIGVIYRNSNDNNCLYAKYIEQKLKRLYRVFKNIDIVEYKINELDDEEKLLSDFNKSLPADNALLPDVIYPMNALIIPVLYEYAQIMNWKVGKDIKLISLSSGLSFNQLRPKMSFIQVPNCTMGEKATELLVDFIRNKVNITNKIVKANIIEGKSF